VEAAVRIIEHEVIHCGEAIDVHQKATTMTAPTVVEILASMNEDRPVQTFPEDTPLIALRDGTYVERDKIPAGLLRRYDSVADHTELLRVVAEIRQQIDPKLIIRKVNGDELRKSTFAASSNATSGNTNYSVEGEDKHSMHLGRGDYILRAVVSEELKKEYDKHRKAYHGTRDKIRGEYSGDVVNGGSQETYLNEEVQRAATAAEARRRYRPGGPEHLSDAHSAISRISHVEIDFSILMESIRVSYARALASGEHENSAFQAEMGRKVLSYIAQMAAPSQRANNAIIAGQRNQI
jgi:hypothetical protein